MANNQILKDAIAAVIKQNGNNEITGIILRDAIISVINQFGAGSILAGVASPSTNPGNLDQNMFYLAFQNGVYTNFGAYNLTGTKIVLFNNLTGSWVASVLFDIDTNIVTNYTTDDNHKPLAASVAVALKSLIDGVAAGLKVDQTSPVPVWTDGIYISNTGQQGNSASYRATQHLLLPPGVKNIHITGVIRYGEVQNAISFYNNAGGYISGLQIANTSQEQIIDVPANAYSYRLSNTIVGGNLTPFYLVTDIATTLSGGRYLVAENLIANYTTNDNQKALAASVAVALKGLIDGVVSSLAIPQTVPAPVWTDGKYISTNGQEGVAASYRSTQSLKLPTGVKKIHISGTIRYGAAQNAISFYNAAGQYISGLQIANTSQEQIIDVPTNAVSYRLSNESSGGNLTPFFTATDVAMTLVGKEFDIEMGVVSWIDGFFLSQVGASLPLSTWSVSDYIYVPDDSLFYTARVGASIALSALSWYSHADEKTVISSVVISTDTFYNKQKFDKPAGANFARIAVATNTKDIVKIYLKNLFRLFTNSELNKTLTYFNEYLTPPISERYINSIGALSNAGGWQASDFMPCLPGGQLLFTGTTGTAAVVVNRVAFYSTKNETSFISGILMATSGANTYKDEVIAIPAGANYYRVCASGLSQYNTYLFRSKLSTILYLAQREATLIGKSEIESKLVLPQYLDSVIGRNNDVFLDFSNLNPGSDPQTLVLQGNDAAAPIKRRGNSFRHVPVAGSVNTAMVYSVRDRAFNIIESKTLTLRPTSKAVGNGTTEKNITLSGDSLVDNSSYPNEVWNLLAQDADFVINRIGTRGGAVAHEGRGSWRWADYINPALETTPYAGKTNAFMINGVLNFKAYVENNFPALTRKEIDIFSMNLGTNDVSQGVTLVTDTSINNIIANAKVFIDAFFNATTGFPNAKFIIGLCAIGAPQLPVTSGSAEIFKRSISRLNQKYIEVFDNGKYHPNLTTVMHGAYIDRVNSYPFVEEAINDYVTTTMKVYTDGIHPGSAGYQQFGRGVYGKIRGILAGNL